MNERDVQAALEVLLHSDVWIGDDGEPLDYLPERETRIGTLAHELAALVAQARSDALREARCECCQGRCTCGGKALRAAADALIESRTDGRCACGSLDLSATLSDRHDRGLHSADRCIGHSWLRAAASSHPTGNQPLLRSAIPKTVGNATVAMEDICPPDDHPTGNQP